MQEGSDEEIRADVMLESMTESVLITSADLEAPGPFTLYVNAAFERMTGWNRAEICGKSPRILQGPKTEYGIFQDLRTRLEQGAVWMGRTVNYRKDGSEFHMEWSITPIRNEKGRIVQYLAVQREVTQIVLTEMRLAQAIEVDKERLEQIEKTNRKLNRLIAEQSHTLDLFSKYVPESIVKKALAEEDDTKSISTRLDVALLFCDIRGFTSMIEDLMPEEVVSILNIYYSSMSDVISKYNGVINQFVGDEIFVAFGAPVSIADPELAAVNCALDMMDALKIINKELKRIMDKEMIVGIGINFGSVIAGNLGSDDKLSYSITGSEVVTAKRIESLTSGLVNAILISQSIYQVVKEHVKTKPWGKVEIKGKNEVFQVVKKTGTF